MPDPGTVLWSGDFFQEVGVYEWEEYEAYAFDAYHDVSVLVDALHGPLVAFERTRLDAYALPFAEFALAVYLAAGGVFGGEQPEEGYLTLGDDLYLLAPGIAVNPEGDCGAGVAPSVGFKPQGVPPRGAYEEYVGYYGASPSYAGGVAYCLRWEEYIVAVWREDFFGAEVLACLYGEPAFFSHQFFSRW